MELLPIVVRRRVDLDPLDDGALCSRLTELERTAEALDAEFHAVLALLKRRRSGVSDV